MSRLVTLVLVTADGENIGSLPPYPVTTPWWSEVASVVEGARACHGAEVTVLRLLDAVGGSSDAPGAGGRVVYLAELHGRVLGGVQPDHRTFDDDPRRASWARPGGPAADLAWAEGALGERGRFLTARPVQLRTWNLSSIWRLATTAGDVWLKVVPAPLAHEGPVVDALGHEGAPVPPVVAFDGRGRMLLEHVAGCDQWEAGPDRLGAVVRLLTDIQAGWRGRVGDLLALGVPDWRPRSFAPAVAETVAAWADEVPAEARLVLDRLVASLDARFAGLEACGVPDTLVHGDFHPGNVRSDGTSLVLLDWGDCGVGHPLLDTAGFLERVDARHRAAVEQVWLDRWRAVFPGSDPCRALQLVRPLAALRRAVAYHRFVDAFEASERPYHEADVPRWLLAAASWAWMDDR